MPLVFLRFNDNGIAHGRKIVTGLFFKKESHCARLTRVVLQGKFQVIFFFANGLYGRKQTVVYAQSDFGIVRSARLKPFKPADKIKRYFAYFCLNVVFCRRIKIYKVVVFP